MNEDPIIEPELNTEQKFNSDLKADNLLSAEFAYIAQSAFQANEDRARVSTYYIITFGSLAAAILSLQADDAALNNLYRAFIVVFLTLALFGMSTILQLVRLRQAWTESVKALNQIKEYYVDNLQSTNLTDALRWRTNTIPKLFKPWSIAFLLVLQVALLGGVSFGAAVYFYGLTLGMALWGWAIIAGLIYVSLQILLYWYPLRE